MSNFKFDLNAFIKESKDVLVSPKTYFPAMKITGGVVEPLIKAVIYGVVAGIIAFIWSLFHFQSGFIGGAFGIMTIFWMIFASIAGLFVGGVILLVISAICKGNTDYEACVRVTAASMVLLPVIALLEFISMFNSTAGLIVYLIVGLYSLYLVYHGLNQTLKANSGTSKIIIIVLGVLLVLFTLFAMKSTRKVNKLMREFNKADFKELIKDTK